jgi:putative transposase
MGKLSAIPHYIRNHVSGGSYFFMVTLLERHRHLLTEYLDALRTAFIAMQRQRPFHIDAIVVSPLH